MQCIVQHVRNGDWIKTLHKLIWQWVVRGHCTALIPHPGSLHRMVLKPIEPKSVKKPLETMNADATHARKKSWFVEFTLELYYLRTKMQRSKKRHSLEWKSIKQQQVWANQTSHQKTDPARSNSSRLECCSTSLVKPHRLCYSTHEFCSNEWAGTQKAGNLLLQ